MKVGDKFYTEDGKGIFYSEKIIEIKENKGTRVKYAYLESYSHFSRPLEDFAQRNLHRISPVMELFYEQSH